MTNRITIDSVSDVVSPWCIIGYKRVVKAISEMRRQNIGLNETEGLAKLEDGIVRKQVQAQEAYWKSLGISAVPTMIFNNSSSLTGAQPITVYKQVLSSSLQGEPLI